MSDVCHVEKLYQYISQPIISVGIVLSEIYQRHIGIDVYVV